MQARGGEPAAGDGRRGEGRFGKRLPSLAASPNALRRLLFGFAGTVVVAAWATAAYLVLDARATTYGDARKELLGAQYAMRAHVQRTFQTARAFLTVVDAWLASPSQPVSGAAFSDLQIVIDRLRRLEPGQPEIRLVDRGGRTLDSAGQPVATDAADRTLVDALRPAPVGAIHVGLPAVSRTTGADYLPLSLKAGANRFGVAFMTIEIGLEQFRRTYANLVISAPAIYGILRDDSHLLFQTPTPPDGIGRRIDRLDLAETRTRWGPIGVFEHDRLAGSGRRLSGFAFLDGYPLVTYASFLSADIDGRWRPLALDAAAFAAFVTLVTALLTSAALHLLSRYAAEAERVRAALAEAQAAHAAKSGFMAQMTHEFRTPLNAILGFSEVIGGGYLGPLPSRYQEYGADIQRAGRHLLGLVDRILDIAGLEAGTAVLRESEIELQSLVEQAVAAASASAAERGVRIQVVSDDAVRLAADRRMVAEALTGILINAVRFSPPDGTVEVRASGSDAGATIVVADDGPGIPEAVRSTLFEPFGRQHHAYIADDHPGPPLGLLLARLFMEIHGGTIAIDPRPEGGTKVTLGFPVARIVAAAT